MLNAKFFCDRLVFFSTRVMFVGALVVSVLYPASADANRLEDAIYATARSSENHALAQSIYSGNIHRSWGYDTEQGAIDVAMSGCLASESFMRSRQTGCRIVVLNGNYVNDPLFNIEFPVDIDVIDGISGRTTSLRGSIMVNDFYEREASGVVSAGGRELCTFDLRWRRSGYRVSASCLGYGSAETFSDRTARWTFEFEESEILIRPDF